MTAHSEKFIQEIFLHNANVAGFLMKPIDRSILQSLLKKVFASGEAVRERITVKIGSEVLSLPTDEIYFIESDAHRLGINTASKTYKVWEKLSDFITTLPWCFAQCHKSYAVNLKHVDRIKEQTVHLDDGRTVPMSRSKNMEFVAKFFDFTEKAVK